MLPKDILFCHVYLICPFLCCLMFAWCFVVIMFKIVGTNAFGLQTS